MYLINLIVFEEDRFFKLPNYQDKFKSYFLVCMMVLLPFAINQDGCKNSGSDDNDDETIQVSVPNIVGMARAAAESTILAAGLTIGIVTTSQHATIPAGSVISQNPAEGTMVDESSAVNFVVSTGPGATQNKIELWTSGTNLRGINIYQRRVYIELDGDTFMGSDYVGPPYNQEDFDRYSAMGCNYVNISHPGLFNEAPPYGVNQDIQDNLDKLLAKIEQADMFAVICFRTGPGRSEFTFFLGEEDGDWFDPSYYNDLMWTIKAAQDAWITMWRYVADRYKNHPIVVGYDLMVEPNSNEPGIDIWDPVAFENQYNGTLRDWNLLYPKLVAAIREVDPETPVLVGANAYSRVSWLPYLKTITDSNTIYVVHQYEPAGYTHQAPGDSGYSYPGVFDANDDGVEDQINFSWMQNLMSAFDTFISVNNVFMAVNEFGLGRFCPGADEFMRDSMDLYEARGFNYAFWVLNPSYPEYNIENDEFDIMHGPDPNNHTNVTTSDLITVVKNHWALNTKRPSNTVF